MAQKQELGILVTPKAVDELWWLGLIQGVLAIFFGITAVFWPGLTLVTLIYLFSSFVLLWGIIEIIHGLLSIERRSTWRLTLLFGVIGLGVGIYLIRHPGVSFVSFILIIGLTLIVRGLLDILGDFFDRRAMNNRILTAVVGMAAIIAGIFQLFQPVAGGVAFVWILGLYSIIFGPLIAVISLESHEELASQHLVTSRSYKDDTSWQMVSVT